MPAEVSETDIALKARLNALKSRAHFLSINGGTMDQLRKIIHEVDSCSQFVVSATQEFQKLSQATAVCAARLEWLQSIIRDATEVIERKTAATYCFCRKLANRIIAMPEVRAEVFKRAGYKCELCGSVDFISVDHIIPVKRGGTNAISNLQCLCLSCNCSKGSR